MKNNIYFISYYFPPYNVIASQRAAKLCIEFSKIYKKVTVFTLDLKEIPEEKIDNIFFKELYKVKNIRIIRIPLNSFGYENPKNISFIKKIYSSLITRLICSNGFFWYSNLNKEIKKHLTKDSLIFTSGSPFITFFLAYRLKIKLGCNYILDYRDLWTENPRTNYFYFSRLFIKYFFENKIINEATAILTVSNGCYKSIMKNLNSNNHQNLCVLENLPNDYQKSFFYKHFTKSNFNSKYFNINFVGTVYKNCTFRPIIFALKKLPFDNLKKIRVNYYGQSSGLVVKEFNKYGLGFLLVDHGYVSKVKSIKSLIKSNVVVSLVDDSKKMNSNPALSGLMTTKIFDYFLSNKPILNISPKGSDIENFSKKINYNLFYSFNANETNKIKSFLLKQMSGSQNFPSNIVDIPSFNNRFKQIKIFPNK